MKVQILGLAASLILSACAVTPPREPPPAPHVIQIVTVPDGAIIEMNNGIVGISPCSAVLPDYIDSQIRRFSPAIEIKAIPQPSWAPGYRTVTKNLMPGPVPGMMYFDLRGESRSRP